MLTVWTCHSAALAEVAFTAASPSAAIPHLTHYVIVRRDLPLGMLAAQVVHAAGESSPGGLCSGTHAVVLAARDERALRELAARLSVAGIGHVLIEESDTPYAGAAMSIGLEPVDLAGKEALRRHLSSLPLLR